MQVTYSQPCRAYTVATIEFGDLTWDNSELSVRLRCPSKNGGFSRGSPEMPMYALLESIEVTLTQGGTTPMEVADTLHRSGKLMDVLEAALSFVKSK